jgi:hypothetical protein
MSGGHFDYQQYQMNEIADRIDGIVKDNVVKDEYGYASDYSEETLDKFKKAASACREASKMVHRVDWLVSGDDGEESFHERWKKEGLI